MSNSNVPASRDAAQPAFPAELNAEQEEALMQLAAAELAWREAADALDQANASCKSARDTVLRAEAGQPVEPSALREAQRVLQEIAPTRNALASAHGAALREYRKAEQRWTSLLPRPPQRDERAAVRFVTLA